MKLPLTFLVNSIRSYKVRHCPAPSFAKKLSIFLHIAAFPDSEPAKEKQPRSSGIRLSLQVVSGKSREWDVTCLTLLGQICERAAFLAVESEDIGAIFT
jgi:hypothetical protein